ncbi:hypothetical protein ElyMa_005853600 [Elysia marginata]|uniref:Uncharacterized protein n=1 Tax=Elysia marginata TaxID=1093978 RepID=A0AAV4G0P7_9GAST|nr:hypothetical protein ElyMa_005853600 [Elysia marginata]
MASLYGHKTSRCVYRLYVPGRPSQPRSISVRWRPSIEATESVIHVVGPSLVASTARLVQGMPGWKTPGKSEVWAPQAREKPANSLSHNYSRRRSLSIAALALHRF